MTPESTLVSLFWLQLGAMLHTYFTYPLSLHLLRSRYPVPPDCPDRELPSVAVLIPAFNEETVIGGKLANTLALDYPAEKLRILVGSDGSTDGTCRCVREVRDSRIALLELPGRSGKSAVLNDLAAEAQAEILVTTDANVSVAPDALRKLVRHFADPGVGAVSGGKHVHVSAEAQSVRGETAYSDFENYLKTLESAVGGVSGCRGALVAFRRRDFVPFRPGAINDDAILALVVTLAGKRVVFDPEACADEDSGGNMAEEFRRRVRIGSGNAQALLWFGRILHPRYGIAAYTFFSHKILRWIFPFLMIGTLLTGLLLAHHALYRALTAAQILFYGAALVGAAADRLRLHLPLVSSLYHFVAMNAALLIGFLSYRPGGSAAWQRTVRRPVDPVH